MRQVGSLPCSAQSVLMIRSETVLSLSGSHRPEPLVPQTLACRPVPPPPRRVDQGVPDETLIESENWKR